MLLKFQPAVERPEGVGIANLCDLWLVTMTTHLFRGDEVAGFLSAIASILRSQMQGVTPTIAKLSALAIVAEPLQYLLLTVTRTPELMADGDTRAAIADVFSALQETRQFIERLAEIAPSHDIPQIQWIDALPDLNKLFEPGSST